MACFPIMADIDGRPCLVVGGGAVACKKVRTLREFGAHITVVAPEIGSGIEQMCGGSGVRIHRREFEEGDIQGMFLVVAATDDRLQNHLVGELCRRRGVLFNAADQPEDCDFIFPAYLKEGDVVAAFSSGGNSPLLARYLKERNRGILTEEIGAVADLMGDMRELVKQTVEDSTERKLVYREMLAELLAWAYGKERGE